jgi:hypothetical protein
VEKCRKRNAEKEKCRKRNVEKKNINSVKYGE